MKAMKRTTLIFLAALFVQGVLGQQLPLNSQYILNQYEINPAVAGSSDGFPLGFTFRKLWMGLEGSPSIQTLSGHMEVAEHMGVGLKVFNVSAGPLRRTGGEVTYAYHIPLGGGKQKLSFGLSGLFYQYNIDISGLEVKDVDDPVLLNSAESMFVPDVSFGTYFHGDNYYVGLAVPQLLSRKVDLKSDVELDQQQVRHYFLHGGYRFDINEQFSLEPSALIKIIEAGVFQADINLRLTYQKMVSFGLSYRTSDAIVIQLGYHTEKFLVGYAYDITLSDVRTTSSGSHEIMMIYTFDNFIRKSSTTGE
jgi:type IX secretion system PorP/SprF family membrane protein